MFLGYFFSSFNYVFYCLSRFLKTKTKMLVLDILAKTSLVLSLYFLGSLTGSYGFMLSIVTLVVIAVKEYKNASFSKILNNFLYAVFCAGFVVICVFTFKGAESILVTAINIINLTSNYYLNPQQMRIVAIISSAMYLTYSLLLGNWVGLAEVLVITSSLVAYVKYRKNRKEINAA